MRGPRTAAIAHKKPDAEMLKKHKAEKNTKKDKASKKDSDAPKRPSSAFFIFMEDFRKSFKENYPDQKSGPAVGKAGGEKWKSMSDADKAPYAEKALKRKADYEKAVRAYKTKLNGNGCNEPREESFQSTSEIHDETGQEASS
ncbi:hypothetical protein I3842_03G153400 [Carya illinoinensis]|uniref:HMG box domain-containing protein n=1 Tax=Carya illinoinensis TaxID=32201 RepID=A0A922FKJ9_CARIL|nr:hypothetical protein I3842_03G153400 [Carya illinoinensis]